MAIFSANITKSLTRQESSDNQKISTALHVIQDWRPSSYYTGMFQTAPSVDTFLRFDASPQERVFSDRVLDGVSDPYRYKLIYTYNLNITSSLDIGLITRSIDLEFGLFNGFYTQKTINTITVTSGQGVSINAPIPGTVLEPISEIPVSISVDSVGSVSIAADIIITLVGDSTLYTLSLSGIRATMPYLLDAEWGDSITVSKRFQTMVTRAQSTEEYRTALRHTPVREISASLFFAGQNAAMQALSSIRASSDASFIFPYVMDATFLTAQSSFTEIPCDTTNRRFYPGSYALIASFDEQGAVVNQEGVLIESVEPGKLIPQNGTLHTYAAGTAVYPAMVCAPSLEGESSVSFVTDQVGQVNIKAVELYGKTSLPPDNPDYVPTLFDGNAVFPFRHNWSSSTSINSSRAGVSTDSGRGTLYYVLGTAAVIKERMAIVLFSRQDSWDFAGFITYVQGMRKPFWIKSKPDCFSIQQFSGGGGTALTIIVDKAITKREIDTIKALVVEDNEGYEHWTMVDSIIENPTNYTIVTGVTGNTTIARINIARLVVLDSDVITESFETDELSTVSLTVRELEGYGL